MPKQRMYGVLDIPHDSLEDKINDVCSEPDVPPWHVFAIFPPGVGQPGPAYTVVFERDRAPSEET